MQIYTIKKGRTDWRPRDPFRIFCNFEELIWEMIPDTSMQFHYADPITTNIDRDWKDWKKIGGISLADPFVNLINLFVKSRDSIQLGWRWNVDLQVHEFAVYVNEKGKFKAYESPLQVLRCEAGTRVGMRIRREGKRIYYVALYLIQLGPDSVNEFKIKARKHFNLFSYSGIWYGGKNNSSGPWGGKAPKDMRIQLSFSKRY